MPRTLQLTWHKPTSRWKKFYRGKTYYFKFGTSKSDVNGYRQAWSKWQEVKGRVDAQAEDAKPDAKAYRHAIQTFSDMAEWLQVHGDGKEAKELRANSQRLRGAFDDGLPLDPSEEPHGGMSGSPTAQIWGDRIRTMKAMKGRIRRVEFNPGFCPDRVFSAFIARLVLLPPSRGFPVSGVVLRPPV